MSDIIASARRSSLVSTFGVGAIFPVEDDSVMICGIDEWGRGDVVSEPRLEEVLGVKELRTPPSGRKRGDIPAVRFPEWAFCPRCRALGPAWDIAHRASRLCAACDERISPSRFVACCPAGHIEDFPYRAWAHSETRMVGDGHAMKLVARGRSSALSDLVVECTCGASRTMDGSFAPGALKGVKSCGGRRPWLPAAPHEDCSRQLRTLQRGSSNVWFAVTRSAISIPSVSSIAGDFVRRKLAGASTELSPAALAEIFEPPRGCTREDVATAVRDIREPGVGAPRLSEGELRAQEYQALVNGVRIPGGEDQFTCEEVDLTGSGVSEIITQVSRVSRLREVRALQGFSRLYPWAGEAGDLDSTKEGEARLVSVAFDPHPVWLPAIEVLGEGVFVRLDEGKLDAWVSSPFARERTALLRSAQERGRDGSMTRGLSVTPRSLVIHSLAHMLLDELSLSAGYPTASIRERVYDAEGQAGILIYTATADGAGSLGGLAAQSHGERMGDTVKRAVQRARWCTADPICSESTGSGVGGLNLAACHACLLVPETSCERFNLVLDRASVVGLPEFPSRGLFGDEYL